MGQYSTVKKKREVDPNAPPRPTLLGHEKEFKGVRSAIEDLRATVQRQQESLSRLGSKLREAEREIEQLRFTITKLRQL